MFIRLLSVLVLITLLAFGAGVWIGQNSDWDTSGVFGRDIEVESETSPPPTATTNAIAVVSATPFQIQPPTVSPITESVLAKYPTTVPAPVVTPSPDERPTMRPTVTPIPASIFNPLIRTLMPVVTVPPTRQPVSAEAVLAKYPTTVPVEGTTSVPSAASALATVTPLPVEQPPTATPLPTPTQVPTPTPFPEWTPTPTSSPTATPHPLPALRHLDLKKSMLDLVNQIRVGEGLEPVELGENAAAQIHAEGALKGCYVSHWDSDGLKPYMRYSLAGGYQSNSENGHGLDYCIKYEDGYRAIESIATEVRQAVDGWMKSPGHRRNMLRPWHRKLNIEIAWDTYNFVAYQHFEGDYVRFEQIPAIQDGTLFLSGELLSGSGLSDRKALGVQLYYDPPPHSLTSGQLSRTYCYDNGLHVADISPPPAPGRSYTIDSYETEYWPCPSPYDVPSDAPAAQTYDEAHELWEEAYEASKSVPRYQIVVPYLTTGEWDVTSSIFRVVADVSDVTAQRGPGVYTLVLWADLEDDNAIVGRYSVFYGVTPPTTYDTAMGR